MESYKIYLKDKNVFADPPVIKRGKPEIKAREGDRIRIPCRVVGEPAPEVMWFVNDIEIDTERFRVQKSHSLK